MQLMLCCQDNSSTWPLKKSLEISFGFIYSYPVRHYLFHFNPVDIVIVTFLRNTRAHLTTTFLIFLCQCGIHSAFIFHVEGIHKRWADQGQTSRIKATKSSSSSMSTAWDEGRHETQCEALQRQKHHIPRSHPDIHILTFHYMNITHFPALLNVGIGCTLFTAESSNMKRIPLRLSGVISCQLCIFPWEQHKVIKCISCLLKDILTGRNIRRYQGSIFVMLLNASILR